jgi:HAE1 family hydrophobic/amphiphilic exporter-1
VTPQSNTLSGAGQSGTLSQTLFDVNSSITKLSRTGGGNYQLFFNNTRATTSSSNDLLSPTYAGNLGVTFTQPLWRDRSIDFNRRQIRVQRKRLAQSDVDFRRLNTEIISQVQRAYWDLAFALHDQQNLLGSLNLIRQQVLQTEQRIEAGSTAPLERAEVQTELSNRELEVLLASQTISVAENILKRLILRNPRSPEWSVALIPTDKLAFDVDSPIVIKQILEEAQANRPELRRLRIQREIVEIDRDYFQNQTRPRIDINATLSTTGLAGAIATRRITEPNQTSLISTNAATNADAFLLTQINTLRAGQGLPPAIVPLTTQESSTGAANLVGGYPRMLGNLFSFNTRNIVVGLTIQLPLRNKTAKANLAITQIQKEQLTALMENAEQTIEVEVRAAAQAAETARLRVLAARVARQNAEVQVEGEKRLYTLGRSSTFLLFQRENRAAEARSLELRVLTDYNKALVDIQRVTATTLPANNVIIDSF